MTSRPVGWRYESHRHYLAAKGIKTKYDANKYFYRKPAPEDPNKSYVGMLNCPWCGEATGVLLDRRLRSSLSRENKDIKPCEKCEKDAVILFDKDSKKLIGYVKKEAILNPEAQEKFKGTPVRALGTLNPDGSITFVNPPSDEHMARKHYGMFDTPEPELTIEPIAISQEELAQFKRPIYAARKTDVMQ